MEWVAFVSQTGTEVYNISKAINRKPKFIVTNHPEKLKKEVLGEFNIKTLPIKPTMEDYLSLDINSDDIITLNGWLRIIPAEFLTRYKYVYNGHPGLITEYPDLKGKDPQIRAYLNKYPRIGSVIHKVIPEVDAGEVLYTSYRDIEPFQLNLQEYFNILQQTSLETWVMFFNKFNK